MKLSGKTIAVTGAGSGIGRELALMLLARGARVAAIDLHDDALAETARLAGSMPELSLHTANITDRERVARLPAEVLSRHPAIDGLINNAGIIQPFVDFNALDFEVIDRMVAVNLMGAVNMTKAFLPHLLERPEAHLTNVSSMGGFLPFPGQTMYGAAKAGVILLTEGLYAELLETRVGVSIAMPGAVNTAIAKNSGVNMKGADSPDAAGRALPADQAAGIILDGMEANRLHILVGNDAKMLRLLSRLAPRWSIRFMQRQMKAMMAK